MLGKILGLYANQHSPRGSSIVQINYSKHALCHRVRKKLDYLTALFNDRHIAFSCDVPANLKELTLACSVANTSSTRYANREWVCVIAQKPLIREISRH
jgi:hypothetical protein